MSISLSVLGSGSSGNCSLLVLHETGEPRYALVDAGLSPRETVRRLRALGVEIEQIERIVVTHCDRDHLRPGWAKPLSRLGITMHVHRRHRRVAGSCNVPPAQLAIFDDGFEAGPGTRFEAVACAHDALGSIGFVIEHAGVRLGYATDLGQVTETLLERFTRLNGLALESNYDRAMQVASGRPRFLTRRIMGGRGHLSNVQSLDAVRRIAERSILEHVVLLHMSRDCNDPRLVRRLYAERAPHLARRLTLSSHAQPTPLLTLGDPVLAGASHEQLEMY